MRIRIFQPKSVDATNWIFRRGEQPKYSETADLSEYRIIEKGYREKTG